MDVRKLIKEYIPKVNIMQLATSADGQPWVCTVHYFSDHALNLYWMSTLERQHSQDIDKNPKVAAAILVHENTPTEKYVIGISISGTAQLLGERVEEAIGQGYITKLGRDPTVLTDIASGVNPHKFYRLKPNKIVLFDSLNFPKQPRQEWQLL